MATAAPTILTVHGSDHPTDPGEGQAAIPGSTDLYRLLGSAVRTNRLVLKRQMLRQAARPVLAPYRYVINLITDPDQNPRVLGNLARLLKGYRGTVINHPDAVLRSTRDQVAARLAGTPGLIVPKVLRFKATQPNAVAALIDRAGLRFPLIVRLAGTHGGRTLGLCRTPDEVTACLDPGADHFATEFVDFQSPDGLYRKARMFFIGRHMVLRHMVASDNWVVHAGEGHRFMMDRPDLRAEEELMSDIAEGAYPEAVLKILRSVPERVALDFFGMDFAVMPGGEVILFEANATMNFLPFEPDKRFAYLERCILPAQIAMWNLVGQPHPAAAGAQASGSD